MTVLKNWSIQVATVDDPEAAPPELQTNALCGEVEGKQVEISDIISVDGCMARTSGGKVYFLDTPAPKFVEFTFGKFFPDLIVGPKNSQDRQKTAQPLFQ